MPLKVRRSLEAAGRKVFLSAVSSEFRSYRLRLANQLGALPGSPYEIKVQEDFRQGPATLLEHLAEYIGECDFVIHLAGEIYGARPAAQQVRALYRSLGKSAPEPLPIRSYTQWEYWLAERFRRKRLTYLAEAAAPRDFLMRGEQSDEDTRLQEEHIAAIRQSGKHYSTFSGHNALTREVFRDLELEPDLKINNLPSKSLGSLFKGRDEFLSKIHTTLGRAQHLGHQRYAAIMAAATAATVHGLGGIGKSRVAIEYAYRYAEEYTALLFVAADSPGSLRQNTAALCGAAVLDLPEKAERKTERQVAAVLRWLTQHPGWLLIFDNADSEEAAQAVAELLGRLTPSGQVLVTSRLSNWPGAVAPLALDVLKETDAAQFLLARTEVRRRKAKNDAAEAQALAVELGHLALALEQAGAYIERYRCSISGYRDELRQRRDKVLTWFDARVMQYPMSVAVAWQTSVDRLTEPALQLLRILAWMAPDPIPESLLEAGRGPFAAASKKSSRPPNPFEALADLEGHSLVTRAEDSPTFAVHRLVQEVTRGRNRGPGRRTSLTSALFWINGAFSGQPWDVRSWPVLTPLALHALALANHAREARISEPTIQLMSQLGILFTEKARYQEAEPLLRQALAMEERSKPEDHPDVAIRRHNLARLLQETNRLEEAEDLMVRSLEVLVHADGVAPHVVISSLNNLGLLLMTRGRLAEAERALQTALDISEGRYGSSDPLVATSANNLAQLLQATNRLAPAETLYRRSLAIREQADGPEHPSVANCLGNLATLLRKMKRLGEAMPLMKRALAIDEKAYGPDHPIVALRLHNLAVFVRSTDPDQSERLTRRALAIDERCFGPDHPNVASDLHNLADFLKDTNRVAEAEPLMLRALKISEQSHDPDHPDVVRDLGNLARLMADMGRWEEAVPLLERVVASHERRLGREDPGLSVWLNNLAAALLTMNRLDEAEPLFHRALEIDEHVLGPHHRILAIRLNNLAGVYAARNRYKEAGALMGRALEILYQSSRDRGSEDPNLQTFREAYAALLKNTGLGDEQIGRTLTEMAARYGA